MTTAVPSTVRPASGPEPKPAAPPARPGVELVRHLTLLFWDRVARAHMDFLSSIAGGNRRHAPAPQGE